MSSLSPSLVTALSLIAGNFASTLHQQLFQSIYLSIKPFISQSDRHHHLVPSRYLPLSSPLFNAAQPGLHLARIHACRVV
ncbi:hypothetical protein GGS21DRAFT_496230 [Xylaria nigripes]|nr:hypothetical protein GGS21DRAFT_496230 [Xylaria nigripes]